MCSLCMEIAMRPLAVTKKLVPSQEIEAALALIVAAFAAANSAVEIYLFGSAALGKMSTYSDIDLLIVSPFIEDIRPLQKKLRHLQTLTPFVIDLVWVDQQRFAKMKNIGGVCMLAVSEGRQLYPKKG